MHKVYKSKMDKEVKYVFIVAGLIFLIFVAALPFFGRVASSIPSLLTLCGIPIN
tara:strand:+ start:596 stop:757 length:162 start_codon:yes stop_codon:yes gene_type:complete